VRPELEKAQKVVIKLGTYILTDEDGGMATARLRSLVGQCARLVEAGKRVVVVSSGSVGLGRSALGLEEVPDTTAKQACAAVGQSLLMKEYQRLFAKHGLTTAQMLVTADDFSDRRRYLNLHETFERLLSYDVVPVVNENDTISTMEIKEDARSHSFGDNDLLSALVATKLGADLLMILTNVDGVYDSNPHENPDARLIRKLDDFEAVKRLGLKGQSSYGRGGIASKIEAARLASYGGVQTVIASGLRRSAILNCKGTLVEANLKLSGRKHWIGHSSGFGGVVRVNDGAAEALIKKNASLLPSGVIEVRGTFGAREVVSVETGDGREIGRGIVYFSSDEVQQIQGHHSREISDKLGDTDHQEVIHRDHLVIFGES
jgi:glutamate 5-kinase